MKGTTTSGFEYEINEEIFKDWRFVQAMAELKDLEESDAQEVDFINVSARVEKIIFKDKGKAFEKYIASLHDGIIPTDVILKELFEIIQNQAETKNS